MASSVYLQAKKRVYAELDKYARLDASGKEMRVGIWHITIGSFFKKYPNSSPKKWADPKVSGYALKAVKKIGQRATARATKAKRTKVSGTDLNLAAEDTIPQFRRYKCPKAVSRAAMRAAEGQSSASAQGALCEEW